MKKICIIGFSSISHMPYLKHYTKILEELKYGFDIIYWDRFNISDSFTSIALDNKYVYQEFLLDEESINKKIFAFFRYKKFLKKIIQENNYEKLIILTTIPSLLIYSIIRKKKYRNNYILDIRDYSYEKFKLYKLIERKIVKHSFFTAISSPGFLNFLPKTNKYVLSLNYYGHEQKKYIQISENDKITITYIGSISYFDENVKFLNLFANNTKYKIKYIGEGPSSNKLKDYCVAKKYLNVEFNPRYSPSDKFKFYEETNLIYNLYGNKNNLVIYAISNKLYESAIFYKPILVSPNTQMEKEAVENGFGFTIELNDKNAPDKLYNWYVNLDTIKLKLDCNNYLKKVRSINDLFYDKLRKFLIG